jgi:ribose/xylose/arabinose/galactoside ABC-type transport system permease subunit
VYTEEAERTVITRIRKVIDWRKIILLGSSLFLLFIGGSFMAELRDPARVMEFFQSMSVLSLLAVGMSWLYLAGIRDFSLGGWYLLALGLAQTWQTSDFAQRLGFGGVAAGAILICFFLSLLGLLMGWLFSKRRHSMEFLSLGLAIFLGSAGIFLLPQSEVWCEPLFCGQERIPAPWVFGVGAVFCFIVSLAAIKYFWPSFKWLGPVLLSWFALGLLTFSVYAYDGLPLAAVVALGLVILSYSLLHHSLFGKSVLAVGDNIEAARYSGVSLFKAFALAGALYLLSISLASFFETQIETRSQAWWAYGRQVDAWLAIFLAGVSLRGGKGCFSDVLLGVLLVSVLNYLYSGSPWSAALLFAAKGLILSVLIWVQTKDRLRHTS